ncbi:MAG TPA: FAD/NAD(P)-binding oxidoreductase [Jiangellaceae bacterium]|nr:FAD/NAD(P)-binding oxidoreductase [Jiangellaceae bacterium]
MTSSSTYVLVGGGLAAGKAAETLRAEGFDGRVVIVAGEDALPYERPPLSKGILLGADDPSVAFVHDQQWYDDNAVEVRTSTRAEALDPVAHTLRLSDGTELGYHKLLLATGTSVRRLRVPGAELDGVAYLRTLPESLALLDAVKRGVRVVVVGAGWIGLEVTAAARHHGCEVTVVEPQAVPLAAVLGAEMGQVFADLHRAHDVQFHFGRQVAELRGADGTVTTVVMDDGTELRADLVVVGIGVIPNIELAEGAGLPVDNGVLVDAALRTSDPDVFAVGDVARWEHPLLGRRVRVEHWANALDGGPVAARSMLGQDVSYDVLPFFYSDQYDLGLEYSGNVGPEGYDEVVVRGDLDAREFCAFWLRDGKVLAGMNVNVWDVQDDIQALVRSGATVDRAKLADPEVALAAVAV